MTRFPRTLVVVALVALIASACAKQESDSEEVRENIDASFLLAHRFVYTERTPSGGDTVVQGIVEDDFRYKARVVVEGDPVIERVVSDDTAAVRFIDPKFVAAYVDKDVVSEVDRETDLEGVDVFEALQGRRWVVDAGGAPPQLRSEDDALDRGVDPIADALDMVDRARALTFAEFSGFIRYSEDSISPTYRTDEDPFPRPEAGSDVTRYDLAQPPFPITEDVRNIALPDEGQFRKFSVYTKGGRVIRIAEDVGVTATVLEDFETFMRRLVSSSAPDEVADQFTGTLDTLEGDEKAQFLLDSLNTFRDLQGDPPIRFRTATYELRDLGDGSIEVELPAADTVKGDLAVLVNLGVKPLVDSDAAAEGEGATTSGATTSGGATGTATGTVGGSLPAIEQD